MTIGTQITSNQEMMAHQKSIGADFQADNKGGDEPDGGAIDWFRRNVAGEGGHSDYKKAAVTAGFAVAGGATGGYLAHRSVTNDQEFVNYVSSQVPRAEYLDITEIGKHLSRQELRILGEFIRAGEGAGDEAAVDMKYITYLAATRPGENPVTWGSIYEGVKLHAGSPEQARQAMQILAACMEKHPDAPPQEIYLEYISRLNKSGNTAAALQNFKTDFGITESDYTETVVALKTDHTSPLWKLGKAGATAAGIVAGALVGLGLGAIVSTIMKVITGSGQEAQKQP